VKAALRRQLALATCALALAACSGRADGAGTSAQQFRVGLITPGSITDAAWNSGAYKGLEMVRDSLGATVSHVEAGTPAAQEEALRNYAAQGYALVFAATSSSRPPSG